LKEITLQKEDYKNIRDLATNLFKDSAKKSTEDYDCFMARCYTRAIVGITISKKWIIKDGKIYSE
jgi:hypothetical protein